ncbi:endo-1,3;1,4-beta-D-glucanase-like [Elaeis guineensis]|uniref:endo-1,3;1,4-beta-D-glucanase-like n=1 Tax=Elaeis guineensis var. tenera TaxID=51953 RepID=UPI003C6D38ED
MGRDNLPSLLELENYHSPSIFFTLNFLQDKVFEDAKLVIEALKNKGVSAIGAAGFCWGAKVVAELAKSDNIKSAVMLHLSFVTVDDIKEVKCHIAILGAEIDESSPPELLKQFEEILSPKSECFEQRTHTIDHDLHLNGLENK